MMRVTTSTAKAARFTTEEKIISRYSNYTNSPVTYLEAAEKVLCGLEPYSITNPANKIAYAQALIALAEAQMKGSTRV